MTNTGYNTLHGFLNRPLSNYRGRATVFSTSMDGNEKLCKPLFVLMAIANDGVKDFFYSQHPHKRWAEYPGLRVYIATLDYILVMKVIAGRPQDIEDAKALIQILQISDAQEVFSLLATYTKQQKLEARVQYIVEELFDV